MSRSWLFARLWVRARQRWRRSLLAESFVLCGSGTIAAVLLAVPMVKVLGHYAQRFSVRAADLTLDSSLLWFGAALAIVAAFFLAYIPRLPSPDKPSNNLPGRGARVTGSSNRKLRIFAITQIAASFWPLTGACVLMKTLYVLEQTRPPFSSANVLALNLPVMNYGKTDAQISEFYREVKERVSTLPGVESVAEGFSVPWSGDQNQGFSLQFAAQSAHRQDGKDEFRARSGAFHRDFLARWVRRFCKGATLMAATKRR